MIKIVDHIVIVGLFRLLLAGRDRRRKSDPMMLRVLTETAATAQTKAKQSRKQLKLRIQRVEKNVDKRNEKRSTGDSERRLW